MSNLIYNGSFNLPSISTNTFIFAQNLSTQQLSDFYWTYGGLYCSLQNGISAYNYPDPSLINQTQFISFQYGANISQQFSVTKLYSYRLTFYYSSRPSFSLNNVQIYLNGVLIDTLTTASTGWNLYNSILLYPVIGINTILFQGQDPVDKDTAISNIQFYEYSTSAPALVAATFSLLKPTQIFGYLTLTDYINGGSTISGILGLSQINYNYLKLPTYLSTNLGYSNSATNAATTVVINSFTCSTIASLPIGLYIVNAYALFTPSSSALYNLKLGLSTTINTISTFNYISDVNQASLLPKSISYQFYLSNSSITTYYIVFNTNIAGSLSGIMNYKFIRIA